MKKGRKRERSRPFATRTRLEREEDGDADTHLGARAVSDRFDEYRAAVAGAWFVSS